ncbi:DMT family transporter [Methanofollis aquaemaris]|uniref:DMT family transporter n=1 Tax=Methanofollis aquaemaris TaxID=126734 RepID=A0A8A3S362_9EURY|nr:DMT family transporter [Methanofollis aquaemaris]QSZ66054.1 DMT family transporter [Methanofollis aquaemaris]
MTRENLLPILYGLTSALLFGVTAPFSKLLLEGVGPITMASLLFLGSGTGLFLYLLGGSFLGHGRDGVEASLAPADLPWLAGVVLFGGVLAPVTLMISLAQTSAATASLLLNFEAVATTVIAVLWYREPVGGRMWGALTLITFSCVILSYVPDQPFGLSVGALGIILTCTFWGMDNNFSKQISAKDPIPIVMIKGFGAGAVTFVIARLFGEAMPDPATCLAAMAIGFLGYGGMMSVFFMMALRGIGSARTSALVSTSPFFGVFVSFLLFTEEPRPAFFVSLLVMALGAWLLISERHAHAHRHEPMAHEHRHRHDDLHHDGHDHPPGTPPLDAKGYHSHCHDHPEMVHDHPHSPDLHHRHAHN